MTDQTQVIAGTLLDEETTFSFAELCRSCGLAARELVSMVEKGFCNQAATRRKIGIFRPGPASPAHRIMAAARA